MSTSARKASTYRAARRNAAREDRSLVGWREGGNALAAMNHGRRKGEHLQFLPRARISHRPGLNFFRRLREKFAHITGHRSAA